MKVEEYLDRDDIVTDSHFSIYADDVKVELRTTVRRRRRSAMMDRGEFWSSLAFYVVTAHQL
jgi:hypothetical protein